MKRFLIIALGLCVLGAGLLIIFSDELAAAMTRSAIRRVIAAAATRGVQINNVSFASARFSGFHTIVCDRVRGAVRLKHGLRASGPELLVGQVDRVIVEAKSFWGGRVAVSVIGGVVELLDESGQPRGERLSQVRAQIETDFDWRHPSVAAAKMEDEMRRLFQHGRCNLAARIDAVARFKIGTRWEEIAVHGRPERGETVLTLDESDVQRVSKDYVEQLTKTEIVLVAKYPVRAPALLRLSEQASTAALELHRRDRTIPQDAYRHIYWSYLLTREFGAAFAEEVTNAHEIDPTYEQGDANRRMDLSNNALGRTYALAEVAEADLPERVRRDSRVVRGAR